MKSFKYSLFLSATSILIFNSSLVADGPQIIQPIQSNQVFTVGQVPNKLDVIGDSNVLIDQGKTTQHQSKLSVVQPDQTPQQVDNSQQLAQQPVITQPSLNLNTLGQNLVNSALNQSQIQQPLVQQPIVSTVVQSDQPPHQVDSSQLQPATQPQLIVDPSQQQQSLLNVGQLVQNVIPQQVNNSQQLLVQQPVITQQPLNSNTLVQSQIQQPNVNSVEQPDQTTQVAPSQQQQGLSVDQPGQIAGEALQQVAPSQQQQSLSVGQPGQIAGGATQLEDQQLNVNAVGPTGVTTPQLLQAPDLSSQLNVPSNDAEVEELKKLELKEPDILSIDPTEEAKKKAEEAIQEALNKLKEQEKEGQVAGNVENIGNLNQPVVNNLTAEEEPNNPIAKGLLEGHDPQPFESLNNDGNQVPTNTNVNVNPNAEHDNNTPQNTQSDQSTKELKNVTLVKDKTEALLVKATQDANKKFNDNSVPLEVVQYFAGEPQEETPAVEEVNQGSQAELKQEESKEEQAVVSKEEPKEKQEPVAAEEPKETPAEAEESKEVPAERPVVTAKKAKVKKTPNKVKKTAEEIEALKAAGSAKRTARQSAKNAVNEEVDAAGFDDPTEEVSNNVEKQPNIVTPEGEKVELPNNEDTDEANLKIVAEKNADGIIEEVK